MDIKKVVGIALVAVIVGVVVLIGADINSRSHKADAPQIVEASTADKWRISEDRSPMDDSKTETLILDSNDMVQGPLGAVKPSLIVRCKEKKTDVYVVTGMAATVEENDQHTVGIRLDDGPAKRFSWNESTDHRSLFASDLVWGSDGSFSSGGKVEFAKRLAGASTLTFQFTPFDGSPQTARFDLRGLDSHLFKVADACGWLVQ